MIYYLIVFGVAGLLLFLAFKYGLEEPDLTGPWDIPGPVKTPRPPVPMSSKRNNP